MADTVMKDESVCSHLQTAREGKRLFALLRFSRPWLEFDDRGGHVGVGRRSGVDGERDGGGGGRTEPVVRERRVRARVAGGHAHDLGGEETEGQLISGQDSFT